MNVGTLPCKSGDIPRHDLTIRRGDSLAVILRFSTISQAGVKRVLDLSESNITLHADWPGGRLTRRSVDGELSVDGLTGTVTLRLAPNQTASIPDGRIAAYRLVREVETGERRTLLAGHLIGIGLISEEGDPGDE